MKISSSRKACLFCSQKSRKKMFVGNMFVLTMTIPLCNEHSQNAVLQDLPVSCSNSITTCLAASPAALQISRPISVSWPLKNCRQWVNTAFLFILYIRRTCSCKTSCSTDLKAHSCLLEPPKNWGWWVITLSLFIPHIFITTDLKAYSCLLEPPK